MSERKLGLVFREENKAYCSKHNIQSDADKIEQLAVPWDKSEQPAIIQFGETWRAHLIEQAAQNNIIRLAMEYPHFWETAKKFTSNPDGFFGTTQKQNDCAAWAGSRCYVARVLHQAKYSEQTAESVNPMALYGYSAGYELQPGNRIPNGGRTLDSVATASNTIGNAPASIAGNYSGAVYFTDRMKDAEAEAGKRQLGWALYEQTSIDNTVDDIFLSLAADYPVMIGNEIAVQDGCKTDKNGVCVGQVNGMGWGGGHATAYLDYQIVNGTEYVFWANSHGNIYPAEDGSPDWGCWLTRESVRKLVNSSYFDVIFTTWAEAIRSEHNYNLNIK
jgi:hypothetical protein